MLNLVYPHGRHYRISFKSQNRILDIILHEQLVLFDHSLLPFLLSCFFIDERICINDVTQQSHITGVYLRHLTLFRSPVILFFILDDLLCPRWSSSLKVNLPLSVIWSYHDSSETLYFIMVSLSLGASCSSLFCWSESFRWTVITCSSEQVSSFFSCRWLCAIFPTSQI